MAPQPQPQKASVVIAFLGIVAMTHAKFVPTHAMIPGPAYVPRVPVKESFICNHRVSGYTMRANGLWSRTQVSTKRIVLSGQVVNEDGEAVPNVRLEMWQPNSKGVYDMAGHECKGALLLDRDGAFYVNTEEPGSYGMTAGQSEAFDLPPWGVKHIHWLAYAPGYRLLVSQFALEYDPITEKGDVDWRLVLAGSEYAERFEYFDHSILKLADNSTADDDLIFTKPIKIVMRKRGEGMPPADQDVTVELKREECASGEHFWSQFRLAVFVEPLNICHPDKEYVVVLVAVVILGSYAFVTIGLPLIILRFILGFFQSAPTEKRKVN